MTISAPTQVAEKLSGAGFRQYLISSATATNCQAMMLTGPHCQLSHVHWDQLTGGPVDWRDQLTGADQLVWSVLKGLEQFGTHF